MNKLLLVMVLALLSTGALAEWSSFSTSEDEGYYVDFSTLRKTDNIVRMWSLSNFNALQEAAGIKYLSIKRFQGYDCKNQRIRLLALHAYSGNMGRGDVVLSINEEDKDWSYVVPNSIDKGRWVLACAKRVNNY